MKRVLSAILLVLLTFSSSALEIHVSKSGSDTNNGTVNDPVETISAAVEKAQAGDSIIIHEGIYREHVQLSKGGESEDKRITIQGAQNENVVISGAEKFDNWKEKGSYWQLKIKDNKFGKVNPFNEFIKYPKPVYRDIYFENTGWQTYGFEVHRGNIFLNGVPLKEVFTKSELIQTVNTWLVEKKGKHIVLLANFGSMNPNLQDVEVVVREKVISATAKNVDYVTVKNLKLHYAATYWAPPTEYQTGLIEPHGGSHWIIENNEIAYSRAVCVSLGMPKQGTSTHARKKGNQIIRNNIIMHCGQAGIAGHQYADNTKIESNIIKEINYHMEFGGWETAGIKLLYADNTDIDRNIIYNVKTVDPLAGSAHGIWLDYENTNVVVSNNLIFNVDAHAILSEANTEPLLFVNNIIVGRPGNSVATYSSQHGIWINNLFVNTATHWAVLGYAHLKYTDSDYWSHNIFIGDSGLNSPTSDMKNMYMGNNLYLDNAKPNPDEINTIELKERSYFEFDLGNKQLNISLQLGDFSKELQLENIRNKIDSTIFKNRDAINKDIQGILRKENDLWGPFSAIKSGENSFVVEF